MRTLITVLAVDEYLFRNEEALRTAIRGTPLSGADWIDIADPLLGSEFVPIILIDELLIQVVLLAYLKLIIYI